MPGEELVEAGDRMIGDPTQDVGEPGLWVDAVELSGLDQREHRSGALAAAVGASEPPLDRGAIDLALDGKDLVDAANRLDCQRSLTQICQHKELAAGVCPTECLGNRSGASFAGIELVESGIGIGLQNAAIGGQMLSRMLAAAIARIKEH